MNSWLYHILVEENSNWIDTPQCQWPPWSSNQQHAQTEIRQVGYLWKGLEKVCKLPDNDVFKDTKSGQKWKTLAIVCPICCNCHTLCLMAGVVKLNFQIGGDTEAFASPPGNQIWRKMFGKKGFDSRLNVAARNQSPFLYFICQYKRMSNRSVLGSLLSLSAPEDPPTFSSSNALAMMTSSGDGMTHQGHWPYHLLENCKSQLLKTKKRSCLVRNIKKKPPPTPQKMGVDENDVSLQPFTCR